MTAVTLKQMIQSAYRVREFEIVGGPAWVQSDRFDVEAKADETYRSGDLPLLMQNLLSTRFMLTVHRETRDLPIFNLTVAKGGPKIDPVPFPERPATGSAQPTLPSPPTGTTNSPRPAMNAGGFFVGIGQMRSAAVPLTALTNTLSQMFGRPVIDKTGLSGLFDINLSWSPDPSERIAPPGINVARPPTVDPDGPTIFTALQEQLGLRLESATGAVEIIVIDSAQKPSENQR
jgi:uncharacterized protein (TIGR03435 family)